MLELAKNRDGDTLTVTLRIEPGEFAKALDDAYVENSERFPVPGYAAGLAPREEIEKLYGATALFDEALDICVPQLYGKWLSEHGVRTVGRPQLTEVTWLEGGGAKFTVVCDVYPEIELGEYRSLEVRAPRSETERFTAAALSAACANMKGEPPKGMVEQKLESMLAGEKLRISRDAIYHVLADFIDILDEAYRETDIVRPKAQVRAEALDVMLQTVSGDNRELSPARFRELVRELVDRYRPIPRGFDETLDRLMQEHSTKKRAMTDEQKIDAAFDAYLGSIDQNLELWRQNKRPMAEDAARFDLLLTAVAERERLFVTDEELAEVYRQIAGETGLELEEVMAEVEAEPVRSQLLRDKARQLIVDSAREVRE